MLAVATMLVAIVATPVIVIVPVPLLVAVVLANDAAAIAVRSDDAAGG
jgi:hypothetical protein